MKEFFNRTIIQFGNIDLKVESMIRVLLFFAFIILLLQILKRLIYRVNRLDLAKKYTIYSLIKYFILVFSIVIGLQILGFSLSVLLAGSAALLVGIGLGLQNLFSDFISGIILLLDSTVKVNDIIDVNGLVCKVLEINLRTTTVLTRDDKYIILPNSHLTRNQLINWTHSEIASRFEVTVGVDYSSDIDQVMKILLEAANSKEEILKDPAPFVRFTDFAESSLNFSVFFWSEEVFRVENLKSELRVMISGMFKSNNIQIPFPQRTVHLHHEKKSEENIS
jgi:small-conductance mechanosensitive channel